MKMKIRTGMFETNSSSMHSLSFDNSEFDDVINEEIYDLYLGIGEYGWGYDELIEPLDKMDYLSIETKYDDHKKEVLIEAIKKAYPNINLIFKYDGYIDHQSEGEIWNELSDVDDVYNFIFGKSKIIIDNDN